MSMDRATLRSQLIRHEGKRTFPYTDTTGHLSIGIGRNLTDVGVSDDEIDLMLHNDIDRCVRDLVTFPWFVLLDPIRQRAMVDLRFNLGPKGLRTFKKFLRAMERREYQTAGLELLNSKWRTQVGDGRALRLERMITDGRDE